MKHYKKKIIHKFIVSLKQLNIIEIHAKQNPSTKNNVQSAAKLFEHLR